MVTRRVWKDYWTESKRVIVAEDGSKHVKVIICCCKLAAATPRQCSDAAGNKTPCRCTCHRKTDKPTRPNKRETDKPT